MIWEHNNIQKIATGQGDDNTIGCPLDYHYFKEYYKMMAVGLSKNQEQDLNLTRTTRCRLKSNARN